MSLDPRSGHGPASPWLGLAAGGAEGPSLVRTGQLAPLPPGSLWCDRVMVPSPALHALVLASLTCGHSAVFRDPVQRGGSGPEADAVMGGRRVGPGPAPCLLSGPWLMGIRPLPWATPGGWWKVAFLTSVDLCHLGARASSLSRRVVTPARGSAEGAFLGGRREACCRPGSPSVLGPCFDAL